MKQRLVALLLALCLSVAAPSAHRLAIAEAADDSVDLDAELSAADVAAEDATIAAETDAVPFEEQLAAVFKRYQTLGACVAVFQNGALTHVFCYGSADADGTPVTADTLFRIGSISKLVTTIGVLQLVESGALSLDGDLGDAFGFPIKHPQYKSTTVTLRQLLTHTAGLRDSGYYTLALRNDVRALSALFSGNRLQYVFLDDVRPGTESVYSNFGGGLFGSLIEQATGQTVDAYMAANVFAPADVTAMYQTALIPTNAQVADIYRMPSKRLARALRDGEPLQTVAQPELDYVYTAGKLMISAPDLARLMIALCDGGVVGNARLLKESSVAELLTLQSNRGSVTGNSHRGLSTNIVTDAIVEGRTLYGHGGKAYGMLCGAYFDPTDRTGVVMLTNGCNNKPMYQGVGVLTRAVVRLCYAQLGFGEAEDPFLVGE